MKTKKKTVKDLIKNQFGANLGTQAEPSAGEMAGKQRQEPRKAEKPSGELKGESIKSTPAVEACRALRLVAELMDAEPSIIQDVLSDLGAIMERIESSPDVLKRKEVADELGLSPERIKDFISEGRIGVRVGSQHLITRKQLDEFKSSPRSTGRPPK